MRWIVLMLRWHFALLLGGALQALRRPVAAKRRQRSDAQEESLPSGICIPFSLSRYFLFLFICLRLYVCPSPSRCLSFLIHTDLSICLSVHLRLRRCFSPSLSASRSLPNNILRAVRYLPITATKLRTLLR